MDSLTSTGESVDGETSWEYVEGEEEEGEEWEYEEVEEEPEVPKREVLWKFIIIYRYLGKPSFKKKRNFMK